MKSEPIFALWPITPFGGTSPDGGDNSGSGDGQGNSGQGANPPANQQNPAQGQGNAGTGKGTPATSDNDDDEDDPYAGLSAKELRRLLADTEKSKDASEADKKKLQDKIDEEDRKKRTKEENLEKDVREGQATIKTLRESLAHQSLINAILIDDRFTWHNMDDVIAKLSDSVKVSDDGKVDGLTRELTRIAKDNDYLVKSKKETQQDPNNQQQQRNNNNGPTGFQPGQGGANQGGTLPPNVAELAKTFPALASRMGAIPAPAVPQPVPQQ